MLSSGANIINSYLQAHLVKYCTESEPPCPLICLEKLVFEMDKSFRETRLQLLLSPILLKSADYAERCSGGAQTAGSEPQLRQGHLLLTGLQFRGHAMFSELDRALGADTLEYGWLMALQCGSLLGTVLEKKLFFFLPLCPVFLGVADPIWKRSDPSIRDCGTGGLPFRIRIQDWIRPF
jgi:hypothetical protein